MDRNTAIGAAAGVTLAVVGAVSALFMTIDRTPEAAATDSPVATVEYVDQYGNPTTAPAPTAAPQVVLVNPDGTLVESVAAEAAAPAVGYGDPMGEAAAEYEEYEEDEYEEHEEYEDEDDEEYDHEEEEHEEDGYEEDEHEDD